jgi:hypothetical protein
MPSPKTFVYNVKFVCGASEKMPREECEAVLGAATYCTEINIFNYNDDKKAQIEKFIVPIVTAQFVAREPHIAKMIRGDKITLPPNTATMDDCCRLSELMKQPNTFKIGYLKIVSTASLAVTAVYTTSNRAGEVESMQVLTINAQS